MNRFRKKRRVGQNAIERLEDRALLAVDLPTPLATIRPEQGVYETSVRSFFADDVSTQEFEIALHGQQHVSLAVRGTPGVESQIALVGPDGSQVAKSDPNGGEAVVLPPTAIAQTGTYTIRVDSANGGIGNFDLAMITNASFEAEEIFDISNDAPGQAQPLVPSWEPLEGAFVATVHGSRPDSSRGTVFYEGFESGELSDQWTTYSSRDDGRIQLTAAYSDDGSSRLWMDQLSPDGPGAVSSYLDVGVLYDSVSGEVSVQTIAPLTVVGLNSAAGIFEAIAPQNLDGVLDELEPRKVYKFNPNGFESISLGRILQPGLSLEFLKSDLSFEGAFRIGGSPDIEIGEGALRPHNLNEAVLSLDLPALVDPELTYDVSTIRDAFNKLPEQYREHANGDGVSISVDGETWYSLNESNLSRVVADNGLDLASPFYLKFQQYDNGQLPEEGRSYDDITITGIIEEQDWYAFSLEDGELAQVVIAARGARPSYKIYDAQLNLLFVQDGENHPFEGVEFGDTTNDGQANDYFIEVEGYGYDYDLSVFRGIEFRSSDVGGLTSLLQGDQGFADLESEGPSSFETFAVLLGEWTGQMRPDLRLELLDLNGQTIAADDDSAADGVNARIEIEEPLTGRYLYSIRGNNFDSVIGLKLDGFVLESTFLPHPESPAADAIVKNNHPSIELTADSPIRYDVDLSKVTVNGIHPETVSVIDRTVTFPFEAEEEGVYDVVLEPGAFLTVSGKRSDQLAYSFRTDSTAPRVIASTIQNGMPATPGLQTHEIRFSEPIESFQLTIRNPETLFEGAQLPQLDPSGQTLRFQADLREGTEYTLRLEARDFAGNFLDGDGGVVPSGDGQPGGEYIARPDVDHVGTLLPEGLPSVIPVSRRKVVEGRITSNSDVDDFVVNVSAGEAMAARVRADEFLEVRVRVTDSVGQTLFDETVSDNRPMVTPSLATREDTEFRIRISSSVGAVGDYELATWVNGLFEPEEEATGGNDSFDMAMSLDEGFSDLPLGDASYVVVTGGFNEATGVIVSTELFDAPLGPNWEVSGEGTVKVGSELGAVGGEKALTFLDTGDGEAIGTVSRVDTAGLTISFDVRNYDLSLSPLPDKFVGSLPGDGVSVSSDGINWLRAFTPSTERAGEWLNYQIDLESLFDQVGDELETLYIKLQRESDFRQSGPAYDNLQIGNRRADVDWYRFSLGDQQPATLSVLTDAPDSPMTLNVYDGNRKLITRQSSEGGEIRIPVLRNQVNADDVDDVFLHIEGDSEYTLSILRGGQLRRQSFAIPTDTSPPGPSPLQAEVSSETSWLSQANGQFRSDAFAITSPLSERHLENVHIADNWIFGSGRNENDDYVYQLFTREGLGWREAQTIEIDGIGRGDFFDLTDDHLIIGATNFNQLSWLTRDPENDQWRKVDTVGLPLRNSSASVTLVGDYAIVNDRRDHTQFSIVHYNRSNGAIELDTVTFGGHGISRIERFADGVLVSNRDSVWAYRLEDGGTWRLEESFVDEGFFRDSSSRTFVVSDSWQLKVFSLNVGGVWEEQIFPGRNDWRNIVVTDEYILANDSGDAPRSLRRIDGKWIMDETTSTFPTVHGFGAAGTFVAGDQNGLHIGQPQSWLRESRVLVVDNGDLSVAGHLFAPTLESHAQLEIVVLDSSGNQIASQRFAADEPINSFRLDQLPGGDYRIVAKRIAGTFTYQVDVTGDIVRSESVNVVAVQPTGDRPVLDPPRFLTLQFDGEINVASVQLDQIHLGSAQPIGANLSGPSELTLQFDTAELPDGVELDLIFPSKVIQSLDGTPNAEFLASFLIDSVGPSVSRSTLADDSVLVPGPLSVQLGFTESLDENTVTPDAFSLIGARSGELKIDSIQFDSEQNEVSLLVEHLPEDSYRLVITSSSNGIADNVGNVLNKTRGDEPPIDYVISFAVDSDDVPVSESERIRPLGSLVAKADIEARLSGSDDRDSFIFDVPVGRPFSVVANADNPDASVVISLDDTEFEFSGQTSLQIPTRVSNEPQVLVELRASVETTVSVSLVQNAVVEVAGDVITNVSPSLIEMGAGRRYAAMGSIDPVTTLNESVIYVERAGGITPLDLQTQQPVGPVIPVAVNGNPFASNGKHLFVPDGRHIRQYDRRGESVHSHLNYQGESSLAANDRYFFAGRRSRVDIYEISTGMHVEQLRESHEDIASDNEALYLLSQLVYRYDLETKETLELFRVPNGVFYNGINVMGNTILLNNDSLIDTFDMNGNRIATVTASHSQVVVPPVNVVPDADVFEIPVRSAGESFTVQLSTDAPIGFVGELLFESKSGADIEVDVLPGTPHFLAARISGTTAGDALLVTAKSFSANEYSVVVTSGLSYGFGTFLGTESGGDSRDVISVLNTPGSLWFYDNSQLVEVSQDTWKELNRFDVQGPVQDDTLVSDGTRLFLQQGRSITSYDYDGRQLETVQLEFSPIEYANGRLIQSGQTYDPNIDARTEGILFSERVYAIDDKRDVRFSADRAGGILRRIHSPNSDVAQVRFQFGSAPFVALDYSDDKLYAATRSGLLTILDSETGDLLQTVQLPVEQGLRGLTIASRKTEQPNPVEHSRPTVLRLDRTSYVAGQDLVVSIADAEKAGQGSIVVGLNARSDAESLTLLEASPGFFVGSIATSLDANQPNDGQIFFEVGDVVVASTIGRGFDGKQSPIFQSATFQNSAEIERLLHEIELNEGDAFTLSVDQIGRLVGPVAGGFDVEIVDGLGNIVERMHSDGRNDSFAFQAPHDGTFFVYLSTASAQSTEVLSSIQLLDSVDFNGDGITDVGDLDLLCKSVHLNSDDFSFDVNRDGTVGYADVQFLIDHVLSLPVGDSNGDGRFDSRDFVAVFQAAEYEDGIDSNSVWSTGDWNCDGEFSSGDFVVAFQSGSYQGAKQNVLEFDVDSNLIAAALLDISDLEHGYSREKAAKRARVFLP